MGQDWGDPRPAARTWTLLNILVYVETVTFHPANARPVSPIDHDSPSPRDPPGTKVAALCSVGAPVSEELIASIGALEEALQDARRAREHAERRLRLQRDHVDDDLAAALAACRSLEEEKLAALGVNDREDTEIFKDEPSLPAEALTLASLHQKHERQKLELTNRYFAELQELSIASARSVESQAQQWHARDAKRLLELETLQQQLSRSMSQEATSQQQIATLTSKDAASRHQIATLMADLHVTRSELSAAQTRIHLLLSSTSWRASRPLRGVARVMRWIKGR